MILSGKAQRFSAPKPENVHLVQAKAHAQRGHTQEQTKRNTARMTQKLLDQAAHTVPEHTHGPNSYLFPPEQSKWH